mgnify:CR=1 FL=1
MIEIIYNIGRIVQHRLSLAGGVIILLLVCIAVLAPHIAPHDPARVDLNQSLAAPDANFPMGTNKLGRCVMSQMIYGARITLGAGALVVLATAAIGMMMGIYLFTNPGGYPWFLWPAGAWGIAVALHLWRTAVGESQHDSERATRRAERRSERRAKRVARAAAAPTPRVPKGG